MTYETDNGINTGGGTGCIEPFPSNWMGETQEGCDGQGKVI